MNESIRWGIAGPGRIAHSVAQDIGQTAGAELVAVGSRDQGRANEFAGRYGAAHAFGSYRELVACDEVDVVYIATPHPQHKAIADAAIAHGKALLVEKPLTATLEGTRALVQAAREANVFCMEAMWSRFHPAMQQLHKIVDEGQLGRIRAIQGELFAQRDFDAGDRLFAPELGGGAILDLGVYPLAFAHDFLGVPDELRAVGTLFDNGVDAQAAMSLRFGDHAIASLGCSLQADGPGHMAIIGDRGHAEIGQPFHHAWHLDVTRRGVRPTSLELRTEGNGYVHEIREVVRCLREGLTESPVMPLQATLDVAAMMHDALAQLGVSYDEDQTLA